ncbi:hypothetical protein, partial [Enterococcus casseliflavus]|uniref:hypothetical protein n=1 Tax=Enterococcus casseliflavus TaxID=37734 RepID=UPI001BCB6BD5
MADSAHLRFRTEKVDKKPKKSTEKTHKYFCISTVIHKRISETQKNLSFFFPSQGSLIFEMER